MVGSWGNVQGHYEDKREGYKAGFPTEWVRIPGRRNSGFHNILTSNSSRPRDGSRDEFDGSDEDEASFKRGLEKFKEIGFGIRRVTEKIAVSHKNLDDVSMTSSPKIHLTCSKLLGLS